MRPPESIAPTDTAAACQIGMDTLQSLEPLIQAIARLNQLPASLARQHIAELCRLATAMLQDSHNELDVIRELAGQAGCSARPPA